MRKWERFTEEEIKDFLKKSKTKKEFMQYLGYQSRTARKRDLDPLREKYPNLDFSELDKNGKLDDLTGKRFGRLIVKEKYKNPDNTRAYWICECDCGKVTKPILASNLKRGLTQSCGCLHKEQIQKATRIDLKNQKFGKLIVLERNEKRLNSDNAKVYWICQCECGKITEVATSDLINGHTKSCGCINSKGELIISQILTKNNIPFSSQYKFNDLVSKKGNKLKFDFAIFKNNALYCLIEFQGEQHYKIIEHWGGEEAFLERQYNDKLKREYCELNNIRLIEISYKQLKDINYNFLKEIGGIY